MKKIVSLKEIIMIIICLAVVAITTNALAIDPGAVVGGQDQTISPDQYQSVQDDPDNTNNTVNNTTNNTVNNTINNTSNAKVYNTNNSSSLPQTGIEDYNIGILLIICAISGIYAYNKVRQYRNI